MYTPLEKNIIDRLARIEEKLNVNNESTTKLQTELYGNGKPGLKHRLTMLEENQRRADADRKAASVWVRWALPLVVTVVSVAVAILSYFQS
ncbi:hypothetical protein KS4_18040 [Poriferisphaera corsica]|uniref:Uncharacterized protein n=1 Tax=Poriferisphaera corsica TaxID=2528020 RepID=A0A517YU48_9BACT|nr:hypothetical protein KS4_18040 [Poriferisphaera corsica]